MKSAYLLTFLVSAVSASTFLQFPQTISCVAGSGVVNFDTTQLENAAASGIADGTAAEEDPFGVSDEATSHCNTFDGDHKVPLYENPLYIATIGSGLELYFGYDKKLDQFVYCGNSDGNISEGGYPGGCSEQF